MWGWLDSIASGLKTLWETLTNLPEVILEGIKGIFVPDEEYIQTAFDSFLDELKMKFSFDTGFFETLMDSEQPVSDIYADYNISGVGSFKLKLLDTKFLVDGVTYFRPFIRGFLVLMMFLFHVKQLIGFFGYDAGVVTGRNEHIKSAKSDQ